MKKQKGTKLSALREHFQGTSREKLRSIFVQRTESNADIWRKKERIPAGFGKVSIWRRKRKSKFRINSNKLGLPILDL